MLTPQLLAFLLKIYTFDTTVELLLIIVHHSTCVKKFKIYIMKMLTPQLLKPILWKYIFLIRNYCRNATYSIIVHHSTCVKKFKIYLMMVLTPQLWAYLLKIYTFDTTVELLLINVHHSKCVNFFKIHTLCKYCTVELLCTKYLVRIYIYCIHVISQDIFIII